MIPSSNYQVCDVDVTLDDGSVQQRRSVVDVDVAAVLYDDLGDLRPLARVLHGEVERGVRPHVGRVDAGAVVDQEADHVGVALPRRHPQGRVLAVVRRLQVGAARHKHADGVFVPQATRRHQRRFHSLLLVLAQLVQVQLVLRAAVTQNQFEGTHLFLVERQRQGGGAAHGRVDRDRVQVK